MSISLFLHLAIFCIWKTVGHFTPETADNAGNGILNGISELHENFPFIVSIQALDEADKWVHGCGGSIVNSRLVLTTCHCLAPKTEGSQIYLGQQHAMRVVAGTDNLLYPSASMQIRRVSKLVASAKCSSSLQEENGWYFHGFAVIVLETPFYINDEVQPMKLFSYNIRESAVILREMISDGLTCFVPDWRVTEDFGVSSAYLMASRVTLIPAQLCQRRFCDLSPNHCQTYLDGVGQVCLVNQYTVDCQEDSGGPLVCNGMVYGTVSFAQTCMMPGRPSVFQTIRPILDLLNSYWMIGRIARRRTKSEILSASELTKRVHEPTSVEPIRLLGGKDGKRKRRRKKHKRKKKNRAKKEEE